MASEMLRVPHPISLFEVKEALQVRQLVAAGPPRLVHALLTAYIIITPLSLRMCSTTTA